MVSVEIKGAFNSVLPAVLSEQLCCLGLSSGIHNFTNFITSRRELCFSADGSGTITCGVGVPQGGVLSPILFNIYTSRIIDILHLGIRYAMYADDLFLYTRSRTIAVARDALSGALNLVIPWLRALGFEFSITLPIGIDLESGKVFKNSDPVSSRLRDCLAVSIRNYLVYLKPVKV